MTVEDADDRRAMLTPSEKRDMQRRHLDVLAKMATDLSHALVEIDRLILEDPISHDDYLKACSVESELTVAAETVEAFTAHRLALAPELRLLPPAQLGLFDAESRYAPTDRPALHVVR